VGRARPLLHPSSMSGGAPIHVAAVRRLLLAAAAPALSLIVVGCSLVSGALHEGSEGGSSGQGVDDGAGGSLAATSSSAATSSGSSGAGQDGAADLAADLVLDVLGSGRGSFDNGLVNVNVNVTGNVTATATASSAPSGSANEMESSAPGGAASEPDSSGPSSAAGGFIGNCNPNEVVDTSPEVPPLLSATGLYQSIASKKLAAGVFPFTPQFPLWTDGAEKHRWVHLPGCAKIDTSDMDRWVVPVGTKVWKEFVFGGVRVETRYIHRWGPGASDFVFQAYQWNAEATEATPVSNGGVTDANGTQHDIPGEWECAVCHGHAPERVLGLSAVQLSHLGPGLTVRSLSAAGRLTVPSAGFSVPGDATARAALGYLHGNCAHCHNPSPSAVWFTTPYSLKLLTGAATVAQTDAVVTAVGVAPEKFVHPGITHRITAGDPASSGVTYRMSVRGSADEMPALGTKVVDQDGLALVSAWIRKLAP
jgi:hypothetical protein